MLLGCGRIRLSLHGMYDGCCMFFRTAYLFYLSNVVLFSYCLVGIAIMLFGVLYWAGWRIILPQVFGYELVPRKETLEDGTVVTLVRLLIFSVWLSEGS